MLRKEFELPQLEGPLQDQAELLHIGVSDGVAAYPKDLGEHDGAPLPILVGLADSSPSRTLAEILDAVLTCLPCLIRPGSANIAEKIAILASALGLARCHVEIDPFGGREESGVRIQ